MVNGSLIPSSNIEFDLGSSTKRWKDVFLSGNTIHLGETTFSRDQDGTISIIDTLATDENGQATAASLQIGSIKSSTGGPINVSSSTLSNMQINAANVTSVVTPTITRIVEQVRVTNVGTAAAMIVNQTGSNNIIAEFQDNNIPTLKIIEDGNGVVIGNELRPGPALIVVGDTLLQGGVTLTGNQTMENLIITNDGTAAALVVNQTGNNSIADFQEAGVSLLKIVDGGNIGVGTTLPAHKLHVVGTTFSTNGFVSYSDARLKTNVKEIESAISLVLQLRGVRYDRIDIPDDERHVGLIAQEVEAVLPEVVKTDASGMKSIAYSDVVAVLVQAVKEQHDQISALKLRAKK